ncbi:MAG: hypothetical protein MJK12_16725 [Colwellia sp.]|nr:hypothetical protein [Colwellia sp.]
MTITTEGDLFNYSNITFTADYEDISAQYRFIINRLLKKLNTLMTQKSAFIDVYYIDVCPVSNIPTLHLVVKGNISNQELDTYLEPWNVEFKKLFKVRPKL